VDEKVTYIYVWNDRARIAYARLREHAGHWHLEWGRRDPPGGEREMEIGRHLTSDPTEAVKYLVESIRTLGADPAEATRVERQSRELLGLAPV
jgi:hypothetical protein